MTSQHLVNLRYYFIRGDLQEYVNFLIDKGANLLWFNPSENNLDVVDYLSEKSGKCLYYFSETEKRDYLLWLKELKEEYLQKNESSKMKEKK